MEICRWLNYGVEVGTEPGEHRIYRTVKIDQFLRPFESAGVCQDPISVISHLKIDHNSTIAKSPAPDLLGGPELRRQGGQLPHFWRMRHHGLVEGRGRQRVVLIDDLRTFTDGRSAQVARTSADGIALLGLYQSQRLDELWLDHDLGGDDTIWPVIEILERAAFAGHPFDISVIYIHSANPSGSESSYRSSAAGDTASAACRIAAVGHRPQP
jgi:hypothetical protein